MTAHLDLQRQVPPLSRRSLAWMFGVATLLGVGEFAYMALDEVVRGRDLPVAEPLIEEMTGAYGAAVLFLLLWLIVRAWPVEREAPYARVAAYLSGLVLYSLVHTSLNWLSRSLIFPLSGLGSYDYGWMPLRFLMEFPKDAVGYGVMVLGLHAWARLRASRRREMDAARLETELARAQLRALQLQLQPHFLFNALNAISEQMYEDPRQADEMIGQLAEMLRRSLSSTSQQQVTLGDELEGLQIYLRLLKMRFGDAVHVEIDVEPGAKSVLVPALLLQPLVENSVQHGGIGSGIRGQITVRGIRQDDRLLLEIEDTGRGASSGRNGKGGGHGLSLTAERLQLLHGAAASIDAGARTEGGFLVRISLPAVDHARVDC